MLEVKGSFSVVRRVSSEDLMYILVTIVKNMVLYSWKLLKVDLKYSHHIKEPKS